MIKSKLLDLLGIEYPILQGGMAYVATARLAAAVSEAGGLGVIASMGLDADALREEIKKVRARTSKPFGVNVMLQSSNVQDISKVVIEEKVPVVVTGAGNPAPYMKAWTDAGTKVVAVVSSVAFARLVEKRGACAVVAEGGESGGHIGEAATMPLVPQIADAVKIPVIAAGGIADGRGMAAAFMLGAEGVQMGTRFLAAKECEISSSYKEKVVAAGDNSTTVCGRRVGQPVRALKSAFARSYSDLEESGASSEELDSFSRDAMRRAVDDGDETRGSFVCGQAAGLVKEEKTCKEIIEETCLEAERLLRGAGDRLT